jgi:hypothetical protein
MNDQDVERLLIGMPRPHLQAGSHQAVLKGTLLAVAEQQQRRATRRSRLRRWSVAACCGIVLLATSGWAAQRTYLRYFFVEAQTVESHVMPDGSCVTQQSTACITSDDPSMTQADADHTWQAVKAAVVDGNYVLIDVVDSPTGPCYLYSILLDDGESMNFGSTHPLP